jgi:hypothetical protein
LPSKARKASLEDLRFKGGHFLQKLFPAFPAGWPGLGLLLLRALVSFMLVTQTSAAAGGWFVKALLLTGAILLLLGLMTPIIAVGIGLASLSLAFSSNDMVQVVGLSGAIALLGPGAFSIDARLFGRREVFIPRRTTEAPAAPDHPRQ